MRNLAHREWRFTALLGAALSCGGAVTMPAAPSGALNSGVVRYRLLLHANPVDPGEAFRCHGGCQVRTTAESYLDCLSNCPGFETTPGVACEGSEVPPVAACFTARSVPTGSEPEPGAVVVAVIANVPLVVGLASVCASQTSQCSYAGGGNLP